MLVITPVCMAVQSLGFKTEVTLFYTHRHTSLVLDLHKSPLWRLKCAGGDNADTIPDIFTYVLLTSSSLLQQRLLHSPVIVHALWRPVSWAYFIYSESKAAKCFSQPRHCSKALNAKEILWWTALLRIKVIYSVTIQTSKCFDLIQM